MSTTPIPEGYEAIFTELCALDKVYVTSWFAQQGVDVIFVDEGQRAYAPAWAIAFWNELGDRDLVRRAFVTLRDATADEQQAALAVLALGDSDAIELYLSSLRIGRMLR